jgi:hypothetical protein
VWCGHCGHGEVRRQPNTPLEVVKSSGVWEHGGFRFPEPPKADVEFGEGGAPEDRGGEEHNVVKCLYAVDKEELLDALGEKVLYALGYPSSAALRRILRRLFWTCYLIVVGLTLSSSTCLLSCLRRRDLALGEAITKPWTLSRSSSQLSEGRCYRRGGSARLARLRLRWFLQRKWWVISFVMGLRRTTRTHCRPYSQCWRKKPRSLPLRDGASIEGYA